MTTPETLETRVACIKGMRASDLITEEEMRGMLESASRTPFTGVRPAAREQAAAQGTAVTSLETQESKAQRELRAMIERLLGTSDRPTLDKAILEFTLDPAKTSSFAKARLETLFREAGLSPTGQGTQLLLILKDAIAGQPLAHLLGEGPVLTLARAFAWKFLCRILAVYGVCTHERTTGNTLSARERQDMEDTYLAKVLKPQEAGDGGADVSRILLNALGWAQKQEEIANTTLKRGSTHTGPPTEGSEGYTQGDASAPKPDGHAAHREPRCRRLPDQGRAHADASRHTGRLQHMDGLQCEVGVGKAPRAVHPMPRQGTHPGGDEGRPPQPPLGGGMKERRGFGNLFFSNLKNKNTF